LLPMVEVAITEPLLLTERRVLARPEIAKPVVVAEVPVAVVKVKVERVDEAGERKPFRRARVVEVASSPVPRVENG